MNFLMKNNVKAIVAACGTVSSVAKEIGESLGVDRSHCPVLIHTAGDAPEVPHAQRDAGNEDQQQEQTVCVFALPAHRHRSRGAAQHAHGSSYAHCQ